MVSLSLSPFSLFLCLSSLSPPSLLPLVSGFLSRSLSLSLLVYLILDVSLFSVFLSLSDSLYLSVALIFSSLLVSLPLSPPVLIRPMLTSDLSPQSLSISLSLTFQLCASPSHMTSSLRAWLHFVPSQSQGLRVDLGIVPGLKWRKIAIMEDEQIVWE